ncbi:DinB family protein [Janibacter limosus]|uniref:DinB family protein n=1 Tax=Janibacter limosus TaxID=53458 RepID=A0AC61U3C8_9MICO|nr:DinB family protein [Janibacter limosus]UUZ44520.1 DinB family protein [Janibacter limosus]
MTPSELLIDSFERVREGALAAIDGLSEEQLAHRVAPDANSIARLVWHAYRVQDEHLADAAGLQQVWAARGFIEHFDLDIDEDDTGYGHTSAQVGKVRAPAELLARYVEAVHKQTLARVGGLSAEDLDRVVDTSWDPPVTLGVRIVSVINDDTQHIGRAAYVRGLLD